MATIDDLIKTRINKLHKLIDSGIDAYPATVVRKNTVGEARQKDGEMVQIAGRIMTIRGHGKIIFADIVDESGRMQAVFKADEIKDVTFQVLDLLDMGDFISATGKVGKTQAGEVSVFVSDFQIISKSLRPLPDKWHGLSDVEERYRQRYVDLLVNDQVKQVFTVRAKIINFFRQYLNQNGFIEVETPILQPIYGGALAKPFTTHHNAMDSDLYLRISDELYLKRLIVGGFEKVYEMAKDFRNEGVDREHNPEFTALEFYWAYADYEKLMSFTEKMLYDLVKEITGSTKIEYEGKTIDFTPPWKRVTYRDVVMQYTGIDIDTADTAEKLLTAIKSKNIKLDLKNNAGYGTVLDELYKTLARPELVGPMFLIHRPTAFVALAKRLPQDPRYTGSFQLLVCGRELINAYNELNDPEDQAGRWRESEKQGGKTQADYEKFDADYIRALEYGMPPTAGWGMGIDRFVAILTNQHTLKDVILFPTLRPETGNRQPPDKAPLKSDAAKDFPSPTGDAKTVLGLNHADAVKLLELHIKDAITRMHCLESEAIMRALAVHFKEDAETWGIIGLLHDIDWEKTKDNTVMHGIKTAEILHSAGGTEYLINTIQSHVYNEGFDEDFHGPPEFADKKRQGKIAHALAAAETSTGLIIATTLVQPDKKLASVKPESLVKKFKSKNFAANCRREIISECEQIGIPLEEFLGIGLTALQGIHDKLGL